MLISFNSFQTFQQDWNQYGNMIIWKEKPWLSRQVRVLTTSRDYRLILILKQFEHALKNLELYRQGDERELAKIYKYLQDFIEPEVDRPLSHYRRFLEVVQGFFRWLGLRSLTLTIPKGELKKHWTAVQFAATSMNYRVGSLNKVNENSDLLRRLEDIALEWKGKYKLYTDKQKKLSKLDQRTLIHLSRYNAFAQLLLQDKIRLNRIFKLLLLQGNRVSYLVKYPESMNLLVKSYITSRIGGLHTAIDKKGKKIRLLKEVDNQLCIRMAYQGKYVPVAYQGDVAVSPTEKVSFSEILQDFRGKKIRPGVFELYCDGIRKAPPLELKKQMRDSGIDIDRLQPTWYHKLPVYEKITFTELQIMFSDHQIEDGDIVWAYGSTRQTFDNDIEGTHGLWVCYEPDPDGDDLYRVWPFGVFAKKWPESFFEKLIFVGNTVPAVVCYPDPNYGFYSHRQKALIPVVMKQTEGVLAQKRHQFIQIVKGDPYFQLGGRNCTPTAKELVLGEAKINILLPLEQAKIPYSLYPIIKPYALAPKPLKKIMLKIIVTLIGGRRELNGQSLYNSELMNNGEFYAPFLIHEAMEKGQIKGFLFAGHTREYQLDLPN